MKANLYAVCKRKQERGLVLEWRVSLDVSVDRLYWQTAVMYVLQPALPLGLVLRWREVLQNQLGIGSKSCWQKGCFTLLDREMKRMRLRIPRGQTLFGDGKPVLKFHCLQPDIGRADPCGDWLSERVTWANLLTGRSLLLEEFQSLVASAEPMSEWKESLWRRKLQWFYLCGRLHLDSGIIWDGVFRCARCGSGESGLHWSSCGSCGGYCPYCEQCLTMGRARFCSLLVSVGKPREAAEMPKAIRAKEEGEDADLSVWRLSRAQEEAVRSALVFMQDPAQEQFLLWAVTGAGKTEMVYPIIASAIAEGHRVLLAAPRRDVVLELEPRLRKAFPDQTVAVLYGGSKDRWKTAMITISTTHQLIRFKRAFDLVIVDELDAYPFHNNPMLQYAAEKVLKDGGKRVWLSATPPAHLQQLARRKKLAHAKVYVRYHGHPLPVPRTIFTPGSSLALPRSCRRKLRISLDRGAQIFIFVPRIAQIDGVVKRVRQAFPDSVIEGTYAGDRDRTAKVRAFRDGEIRMLVTTTILERGVTIPGSDVHILDADHRGFDAVSLVQMAGRAGRSADDPHGLVFFYARYRNRSQWQAVRQIKAMNQWADRHGYLTQKPGRRI